VGICLLFFLAGCNHIRQSPDSTTGLSGIGSAFAMPFYNIIFFNYSQETGNKIVCKKTYQGNGLRSLRDQTVDFYISNAFLSNNEMKEFESEILHIPGALGAVVMTYNLPGVNHLNLTGSIIAGIYTAKITRWNDRAIAAVNPGVALPDLLIKPVYRSDENGNTYVLSAFLSATDQKWKETIGINKYLTSCSGIAVSDNVSILTTVGDQAGAIGYTSLEYAALFSLSTATIQNARGNFVKANSPSISAAAETVMPDDMCVLLTNPDNPAAYPIACFSWILVHKNQTSLATYNHLKSFLNYAVGEESQKTARLLNYCPLPPHAIEKANNLINSIEWKN
jgi:phosphate transport system substrate-binding protein